MDWIARGIAFIGKRVLLAIFTGQKIIFDRGLADALFTALGFILLTAANFLPAWSKARYSGNDNYGAFGFALIGACGLAFAAL